jgi:malonate-semialdehyde dehydrogenase (acetylating)/methylmalonate-semialdehyde dehydrogenase
MLKSRVLRAAIRSVNAYSGASVGVAVESDTAATVAKKFAAACAAQPAWAAAGFEHRKACVAKFQALLAANVNELAGLLSAEMVRAYSFVALFCETSKTLL